MACSCVGFAAGQQLRTPGSGHRTPWLAQSRALPGAQGAAVALRRRVGLVLDVDGGCNWSIWRPTAARCSSHAFLCAISARCGNQQKKRHAFIDLFQYGWRESLSINKPEFWCIPMRAPSRLDRFVERFRSEAGNRSWITKLDCFVPASESGCYVLF